ncbi:hypoxanthine phosphoribosyltransferase [uncultured Ilyobacter sp.]|jgi:hypoxanthine phosphoribosyltransferase|uniref:hypoxanthine phosphoribosyltransferase n=1 Tax=uncultured Ilyobacter sp. TaxID=544433 RepID=UPI0029C0D927|nr:hypoxanthine phosphoribosyltransferase [uncultured Ilyobacter sp.]
MKKHKIEVMIPREDIKRKVRELGELIEKDIKDSDNEVICIGLLKGSAIFMADLVQRIDHPVKMDFMSVSSYGSSMETSGVVKIIKDVDEDVEGKDIVIIEDIIDSGLTLNYVKKFLLSKGAASVKICTLLDKPYRRKAEVFVDYVGFEIPNEFVVGYGIDYAEFYRNLPYIGKVTLLD